MMEMDWQAIDEALARLATSGRQARFWWRDDDAVSATPALDRLMGLVKRYDTPVLLAVIPAMADASLARRLAAEEMVVPAVHGFAHANHAGRGEKKQELGAQRPARVVLGELAEGRRWLADLFGDGLLPVLVPPWNRIAAEVIELLPANGFRGLSVFGPESKVAAPPGLRVVNTHLDPIDWHGDRSLADPGTLARIFVDHVNACARGDGAMALGLLTHHLVHDERLWAFVEGLLARTARSDACLWCDPRDLFPA